MKKITFLIVCCIVLISCNNKNNDEMNANEIFPKGQKAEANFIGTAWVEMLSIDNENLIRKCIM